MTTLVIDASIAVKWVVDEAGTPEALILKERGGLIAPELLVEHLGKEPADSRPP